MIQSRMVTGRESQVCIPSVVSNNVQHNSPNTVSVLTSNTNPTTSTPKRGLNASDEFIEVNSKRRNQGYIQNRHKDFQRYHNVGSQNQQFQRNNRIENANNRNERLASPKTNNQINQNKYGVPFDHLKRAVVYNLPCFT
ncbi:unnamed protein product, partial [Didymodactylos carnosus]